MKFGYVRNVVRAFVSKPLQCGNCKGYGHVSNVCRWEKYDIEESVNGKCCNCGGDHTSDFLEYPVRGERGRGVKDQGCQRIADKFWGLQDFTAEALQGLLSLGNVPPSPEASEAVLGPDLE